jgi:hypothetical protein
MPKGYTPSQSERAAPSFNTDPNEREKTIWLGELVSQPNYVAAGVDEAAESKRIRDRLERLRQAQRGRNAEVKRPVVARRIGVRSITFGLVLAILATSPALYLSTRTGSRSREAGPSHAPYRIGGDVVLALTPLRPLAPVSKELPSKISSSKVQATLPDRANIEGRHRTRPKDPYATRMASTAFPPQPMPTPPRALLDWSQGWGPGIPSASPQAASASPAAVVASKPVRLPPVSPHTTSPTPVGGPHLVTTNPVVDVLPRGTTLHVYVNYSSRNPAEASQAMAISQKLHGQDIDVIGRDTHGQPSRTGSVIYYFADDNGGAKSIAQTIKDLTGHDDAISLMKHEPLPRPGTVEVNL